MKCDILKVSKAIWMKDWGRLNIINFVNEFLWWWRNFIFLVYSPKMDLKTLYWFDVVFKNNDWKFSVFKENNSNLPF